MFIEAAATTYTDTSHYEDDYTRQRYFTVRTKELDVEGKMILGEEEYTVCSHDAIMSLLFSPFLFFFLSKYSKYE